MTNMTESIKEYWFGKDPTYKAIPLIVNFLPVIFHLSEEHCTDKYGNEIRLDNMKGLNLIISKACQLLNEDIPRVYAIDKYQKVEAFRPTKTATILQHVGYGPFSWEYVIDVDIKYLPRVYETIKVFKEIEDELIINTVDDALRMLFFGMKINIDLLKKQGVVEKREWFYSYDEPVFSEVDLYCKAATYRNKFITN